MGEREMIAGGGHRSRDWTALPGELLASIRGHLSVADFVRFPAVCSAWRRLAPSTPAPEFPWLMLLPSSSSFSTSSSGSTCRFFSPSEGKTYLVSVPGLQGTCVGCGDGWVASFHWATAEMSLVNPLTGVRVALPSPLAAMPQVVAPRDEEGHIVEYGVYMDDRRGPSIFFSTRDVHDFIRGVSMSFSTGAACKLAVGFGFFLPPAFVAAGGEKWTALEAAEGLLDIFCHGGDDKYYGVNYYNHVYRWDAGDAHMVEYCPPAPDFPGFSCRYQRHLAVHRPSGDLLLVFIDFPSMQKFRDVVEDTVHSTEAVQAFRHKSDDSGGSWLRLESLGGCSLFLGWNQSICLLAEEVSGMRADCIFFIDQGLYGSRDPRWAHRVWVYDLKDGVLEPYCPPDWKNSGEVPLWFTPNLS